MDPVLVNTTGGRVTDGAHSCLLLADALGLGEQGESVLVLIGQSQRHGHGAMVPNWYHPVGDVRLYGLILPM